MSIALTLIVRDEAHNLPGCLDSVKGLFDELVVVDTGSVDDTPKIARDYGARLFKFEWINDFGAARNHGLDRVRSDYVMRMDADDRLFPGHHKRLARLLDSLDPRQPRAYFCRVIAAEGNGVVRTCDEHRIWPAQHGIRYHGRIHERVRIQEDAPGVPILNSEVRIDHHGYAQPELLRSKLERNLAILQDDLASNPGPETYFDLGRTLGGLGLHEPALEHLEHFLSLPFGASPWRAGWPVGPGSRSSVTWANTSRPCWPPRRGWHAGPTTP